MDRREFLGGATVAAMTASLPPDILASDLPADLTDMSASSLSAAIRQRHVSCRDVMQAYLDRIHRYNPVYNAIVSMVDDDALLKQAVAADQELDAGNYRGWLHGVPFAIKDIVDVEGLPTSRGSPIYAGQIATADDLITARIRSEGAIFIGKTNVPEFAMGSQTTNSVFGSTGSAYDPALTAGGSSGGAACGLATHMLPVADGSDFMGSLRNPGAFNNVIGYRPTQGRVPGNGGGDLFYQQMSVRGPMGRNSEDTYRLLVTLAGVDSGEPLSLRDALPASDALNVPPLADLRIGWIGNYDGYLPMEPGVLEVCEASLADLSGAGAAVEDCKPEFDLDRMWQAWLTLRHWSRHSYRDVYNDPETRKLLKEDAIFEIEGSFGVTAETIYDATIVRADWFRELHRLLDQYDFLVLPTAQAFPYSVDQLWPEEINGRKMDTYHRWMEVVIGGSMAGVPVCNVPAGFSADGRPMGMQIIGRFGEDRRVLEFAQACEAVTGHLERRPVLVEAA